MVNLINDGSLVGFWPLNEPSGAPRFHNYAGSFAGKPSGISFDMHIHQARAQDVNSVLGEWPGTASIFNAESGTTYYGLQLHGCYQSAVSTNRHDKVLVPGMGTFAVRSTMLTPAVAQSGFTIGFWALPRSNGYSEYVDGAVDNGTRQQAWGNSIMARGNEDFGIWMGVSGSLQGGAQFTSTREGGPSLLTGYVFVGGNATDATNPITSTDSRILETPIESGAMVHLTCTYRFIGGNNNQIVLYKNGFLAASGIVSAVLTTASTPAANDFEDVSWTIGGSVDDGTTSVTRLGFANGWNHLVSGVYYFKRVLHEGEVLDMHQQGGLQPSLGVALNAVPVSLSDSTLLAYYPFSQIGYSDVSRHHRPLIAAQDEGDRSIVGVIPGPFGRGGVYNAISTNPMVATSGLTFALAEAPGGFTVAARYMQQSAATYVANIIASMGSTDDVFTPVITAATAGWHVSRDATNANDKLFLRAFPIGATTVSTTLLSTDFEPLDQSVGHFAVVYDNATFGLALYWNGEVQSSGTLAGSLQTHMLHLAGSGFPLMFLGGVLDQNPETIGANADQTAMFDIAIFGRPLQPMEVRGLAASGIDITPILRTPHDPRLCGWWPCDDFDGDELVIQDKASIWQFVPGHLTFCQNDYKWDQLEASDTQGPWFKYRYMDIQRTLPAALASYGNLGLTSGVFSVMGGTRGSQPLSANQSMSSIANYSARYKPNAEDNDLACNNVLGHWLFGFEVTPSGFIPSSRFQAINTEFNSLIAQWGDATDSLRAYLTTFAHTVGQTPGSSGVSIAFDTLEGAVGNQIGSGNLPFGVPSRVMLHLQWQDPYNFEDTASTAPLQCTIYINGVQVHQKNTFSNVAGLWSQNTPPSDNHLFQFGGNAIGPVTVTQINNRDAGFGDIYMRNVFVMRGAFSRDDIEYFAASGVGNQSLNLTGYDTDGSPDVTQITIADSSIVGYWRFSGQPSGETDLGFFDNHLVSLARQAFQAGVFGANNAGSAHNIRFIPGPFRNSDLLIQASGVTYAGDTNGIATREIAPYVASGAAFQNPGAGFSVGFFYNQRGAIAANDAQVIMAYGVIPDAIALTTVNPNVGWAILADEDETVKMVLSAAGNMNLDDVLNAANSGQVVAGTHNQNPLQISAFWQEFKAGAFTPPHIDAWTHYCWTYDPSDERLRCYFNGTLVDNQKAPRVLNEAGPVNNPRDPAARLITLFIHQEDTPWAFDDTRMAENVAITDWFYSTRALTEGEVRYIALHGIDAAQGTETSGIIGGYVHGQDTGSGLIGGYSRGLDNMSGLIGALIDGGTECSGLIGGYVSGLQFADGTIGGFLQGMDFGSGLIAGYIVGANLCSGLIGGYLRALDFGSGMIAGYVVGASGVDGMIGGYIAASATSSGMIGGFLLGGLQGRIEFDAGFNVEFLSAKDFDARLQVEKTASADFDAKLIVFQNEQTPQVGIIIPGNTVTGLVPPFNQYFIGAASGQQGKSIVQTRWNFGDFTAPVSVGVSGAGFYPIQHRFASSGLYIVKFEAIDSNGLHASATRIINVASGIDPVVISVSGAPRSGSAVLTVDFTTDVNILPPGVSVVAKLLNFDDGQSTTAFNPTHAYSEPGNYNPVWMVRDSRGFIWCDSLTAGGNN